MQRLEAHRFALALGLALLSGCQQSTTVPAERASATAADAARVYLKNSSSDAVQNETIAWKSEELADRAAVQLKRFAAMLMSGDEKAGLLDLVADDFHFTPLQPRDVTTVFDDASARVAKDRSSGNDPVRSELPVSELDGAVQTFRGRYSALDRIDVKIVDVTLESDHFRTKALVQISGIIDDTSVQQNAIWHIRWLAPERLRHGAIRGRQLRGNPERFR